MRIYRLENAIMPYAWGSVDGLHEVLGIANESGGPQAEIWMGAHSKAPSSLLLPEGRRPLDRMIASDPERMIGANVASRYEDKLPFLFKALSAAKPLSIQVHPGLRKAGRGFDKENASGIALDAPERNYRDRNHKPELSVAFTRFVALVGFRPASEITAFGKAIGSADFGRHFDNLERRGGRIELSLFFYALMTLAGEARHDLIHAALEAADRATGAGSAPGDASLAWAWVQKLARLWPEDIGVLAPLVFNVMELEPGEAVFIAPGTPHAYLEGTALEIMANSDNVIRCALSDKHIDIPEFISVLGFDAAKPEKTSVVRSAPGIETFDCAVPEFSLSRIDASARPIFDVAGPEILLCSEGKASIRSEGGALELGKGDSVFVCASAGEWSVGGTAVLWRATVGRDRADGESALDGAR